MVRDVIDAPGNGIAGASTQRLASTLASILRAKVFSMVPMPFDWGYAADRLS